MEIKKTEPKLPLTASVNTEITKKPASQEILFINSVKKTEACSKKIPFWTQENLLKNASKAPVGEPINPILISKARVQISANEVSHAATAILNKTFSSKASTTTLSKKVTIGFTKQVPIRPLK